MGSEINTSLSEKFQNTESKNDHKTVEKLCTICSETFPRNSDFEAYMTEKHEAEKTFGYDVCGKMFLLQWRLKKHKQIHIVKPKVCQTK